MNTTQPTFIRAADIADEPPKGYTTWRIDAAGNKWFKRHGDIQGVPPDHTVDAGEKQGPIKRFANWIFGGPSDDA